MQTVNDRTVGGLPDPERERGPSAGAEPGPRPSPGRTSDPARGAEKTALRARGARNHHSGCAAEAQVERLYARSGHVVRDRRWRGGTGEIDLVVEKGGEIVFVEVKASRTHARAAEALSSRQILRLLQSAEAYIARLPTGLSTPMRYDVALVDGSGRIDVIPNALAA